MNDRTLWRILFAALIVLASLLLYVGFTSDSDEPKPARIHLQEDVTLDLDGTLWTCEVKTVTEDGDEFTTLSLENCKEKP